MFNPYAIFSAKLLDAFVKSGKRYFVRQTFPRGLNKFNPMIKAAFLISHYSDTAGAGAHYNALEGDGNRFLYDWQDVEHKNKLIIASKNPPGYTIYANVWEVNWKSAITPELKDQVRRYVASALNWRPARGEQLQFDIYAQFGEPYVKLKLRGMQEVKVKLEEIEKG